MDRIKTSFLSGILAGALLDVLDYTSFIIQRFFGLNHILYADYMVAALLQGKASQNIYEFLSGQFIHLFFTGSIGCLYILFLAFIREKNTVFKGWLFGGIGTWFIAFMIGVLYKIELFVIAEMNTVLSDFLTASIYGMALALIYAFFETKYGNQQ